MTYGPWRRRFRVKSRPTDLVGISPRQYNDGRAEEEEIVKIRFVYRWNVFSIMLSTENTDKIDSITSCSGDRRCANFLLKTDWKLFAGLRRTQYSGFLFDEHMTCARKHEPFSKRLNRRNEKLCSVVSKRVVFSEIVPLGFSSETCPVSRIYLIKLLS